VISQFFYTFTLDTEAHIEIGVHQEDERRLGADRRPYLDISYIILKKNSNGNLSFAGMADLVTERDAQNAFSLDPGEYIVVPYTTGALLKTFPYNSDPVVLAQTDERGERVWHSRMVSTLSDIFRKIDLQLDGLLKARELRLFGKIIEDEFLMNLTEDSFDGPEFQDIAHAPNGLRWYGFYQFMSSYPIDKVQKMFRKLGYDDSLQSFKSRVFVVTFHSSEEIKVKVGNAVLSDINEKAANIMMGDYLKRGGSNQAKEDENAVVFRKYYPKAYANSFAAINKTGNKIKVTIDLTSSEGCEYAPVRGK